jgi:hypothetical protein
MVIDIGIVLTNGALDAGGTPKNFVRKKIGDPLRIPLVQSANTPLEVLSLLGGLGRLFGGLLGWSLLCLYHYILQIVS